MSHAPLDSSHPDYPLVSRLVKAILNHAGGFDKFAVDVPALLRQAFDEVIDAPRTNRFTLGETEKTEKTYVGTKVEILIRNYLGVAKGRVLDMLVDGVEIDIKNTTGRDWMLPKEVVGRPALLVRSSESTALCDVGIVVCRPEYLRLSKNQDGKGQLLAAQHVNIWWILRQHPYPPNFWEVLSVSDRMEIMSARGGTSRIAALFEKVQGRPISRQQVSALAQQHDYMKRIRRNGGARDILAPKGIALLWGQRDRALIEQLGLGPVTADEFISFRPLKADDVTLLRNAGHID
ncbi:NaeI family type II restriction endonuclease [Allorhizobium undicola]|uniref:NaeI family type II restriction endonuclease n=1 Tax=Allorhizobium undicola TaxID=78527 RepID=UPI003D3433B6